MTDELTLDEAIESSTSIFSVSLDEKIAERIRVNDHDGAALASMRQTRQGRDTSSLGLAAYSDYLEPVNFPFHPTHSWSTGRFTRTLMFSMVLLQALNRNARGLLVTIRLIEMLKREIYPAIMDPKSTDDPRIGLRAIGCALIGKGHILAPTGAVDADEALRVKGLAPLRPVDLNTSNIFRDDAVMLALFLMSFGTMLQAEIAHEKLLRVHSALLRRRGEHPATIGSKRQKKRHEEQANQLKSEADLLHGLAINHRRTKAAVSLRFGFPRIENVDKPAAHETLDSQVAQLATSVTGCAQIVLSNVAELGQIYLDAKHWHKTHPLAVARLIDCAWILQLEVRSVEAACEMLKEPPSMFGPRLLLARNYLLHQLMRAVDCWQNALAIEAIVLAEHVQARDCSDDAYLSAFVEHVERNIPTFRDKARTPDFDVWLLKDALVDLLDFEEIWSASGII